MAAKKKTSKKRSDTKNWLPDQAIVYFLDENLGQHVLADKLRDLGFKVEVHRDHFKAGTPDQIWLSETAKKKWL